MAFLEQWTKSAKKSGLIKKAAKLVQDDELQEAVKEIFALYQTDDGFRRVLAAFDAKPVDIASIIVGLMFSGASGTFRGHFVPVSAVLFRDTLAYLLRAERGQVPKARAYSEVLNYFQSGATIFKPERAYH